MKETLLFHSTVLRNIASLFLFGSLIIILQTNHYLLMSVWGDTPKKSNKKIQKLIKSQLQQWFDGLPNYIKAYLSISVCEV
ncbi:MAG: hypothetical protein ACQEWV_20425 [Bacillota bacterium]